MTGEWWLSLFLQSWKRATRCQKNLILLVLCLTVISIFVYSSQISKIEQEEAENLDVIRKKKYVCISFFYKIAWLHISITFHALMLSWTRQIVCFWLINYFAHHLVVARCLSECGSSIIWVSSEWSDLLSHFTRRVCLMQQFIVPTSHEVTYVILVILPYFARNLH